MLGTPRRLLHLTWEYLVFYAGLLYFGVCGTLFTVICALLYPLVSRPAGMRFGRRTIGFLFRAFLGMLQASGVLKLDLGALDALRDEPGILIAPNHPCLLDAVLVIAHVPEVGCIMKAAIWDNPVLGGGARLSGYIRNDSARAMVRQAAMELHAGQPLLVFPEGTRTRAGPINSFRGGFALIAKRARAPIQTVFIETNSAFLSKGWPLARKPRMPLVYRARLGRRFRVEGSVQEFVAMLEAYYREELDRAPGPAHGPAPAGADRRADSREQSHA